MKTGLVLEGGAMRGLFSSGVMDVWMEEGVRFDGAAGISAGAAMGCNYKSGQAGRAIRYNKAYGRDPRYCSLRSLLRTGDLYGADFCYRELPEELDIFDRAAFQANPMEFYAGATDVNTGEVIYHRCEDGGREDLTWIRASASMPLVSRPVEADGHLLLDGGIVDAVPLEFMERQGYDRLVVILTQPLGYRKKKSALQPVTSRLLSGMPRIVEALETRPARYNRQMEEIRAREQQGGLLVIRPPETLGIRRTERNPEELERVYQVGRREGRRRLDEVRAWLRDA